MSDIKSADVLQLDIFNAADEVRQTKLMTAIDTINNRYGKKRIMLAPTLSRGEWSPQQNHFANTSKTLRFYTGMSPRYINRDVIAAIDPDDKAEQERR